MLHAILATILVAGLTEVADDLASRQGGRPRRRRWFPTPATRPGRATAAPDRRPDPRLRADIRCSTTTPIPPRPTTRTGLRALIDKGELVELEAKAPVQVLRNLAPSDAREPGRQYPVEVRLLGGPHAGESWFVPESSVARLVPKVVHPPLAEGSLRGDRRGPGRPSTPTGTPSDPAAR